MVSKPWRYAAGPLLSWGRSLYGSPCLARMTLQQVAALRLRGRI
ncbi:hypothetical protein AAIH70_16460 [Neorhizobium sp. BT27B]